MRHWHSNIGAKWLDLDARHHYQQDLDSDTQHAAMPKCHRCSVTHNKRVAVVEYGVVNWGTDANRRKYTDIRAKCNHPGKNEEVLRIFGMDWGQAHKWEQHEQHAAMACIMGLIFFRFA